MSKITVKTELDRVNEICLEVPIEDKLFSFNDLNAAYNASFRIPIYQRKYSWTIDKLNDFLSEIDEGINKNFFLIKDLNMPECKDSQFVYSRPISYQKFFGVIYLSNNKHQNKIIDIIDGQQRITTWFLFLLASYVIARKYATDYKNTKKKMHLCYSLFFDTLEKWLFIKSSTTTSFQPKYKNFKLHTTQKDDKKYFEELFSLLFENKNFLDLTTTERMKKILIEKKGRSGISFLREVFKSSIFKNYEEIENYIYKTIEKAKSQEVVNKHYTYMGCIL